jgi:hypothetical protein
MDAGDLSGVAEILAQRNALIAQITAAIPAIPAPTAAQQTALRRSSEAGVTAMRQLILSKHLFSTELASLMQEQRLWDTIAAQVTTPARPRIDVAG